MSTSKMNYEMALKLKKAGFPRVGSVEISINNGVEEELWFPTLSELIEACGNGIGVLERLGFQWIAREDHESGDEIPDGFRTGIGSTPEEAIVNLWLILNAPKPSLNS